MLTALSCRLPCCCQRGCGDDGMGSILYIRSFDVHSLTPELSKTEERAFNQLQGTIEFLLYQ